MDGLLRNVCLNCQLYTLSTVTPFTVCTFSHLNLINRAIQTLPSKTMVFNKKEDITDSVMKC